MKILFLVPLLFVILFARSQAVFVHADPSMGQVSVSSPVNNNLAADAIPLDDVIKLNIPIFNLNKTNSIPVGSCKININLGSNFIVDPLFNFSSLPSSNFITWSVVPGGREVRGELKANLPADFKDTVVINVKGNVQGQSFFIINFPRVQPQHFCTVIRRQWLQ